MAFIIRAKLPLMTPNISSTSQNSCAATTSVAEANRKTVGFFESVHQVLNEKLDRGESEKNRRQKKMMYKSKRVARAWACACPLPAAE
mmetsp:Transcript_8285/g.16188  ORF Transcript_8285/g.16188 Transcript_8285/m.16188 type:complete len:88 (-) Transcript_8285:1140-1403(-)